MGKRRFLGKGGGIGKKLGLRSCWRCLLEQRELHCSRECDASRDGRGRDPKLNPSGAAVPHMDTAFPGKRAFPRRSELGKIGSFRERGMRAARNAEG